MYIEDFDKITKENILSRELLNEVFEIDDEFKKAETLLLLESIADDYNKKTEFAKLLRAYVKQKKNEVSTKRDSAMFGSNGLTSFTDSDYQDYRCGVWLANDNGVRTFTMAGEKEACSHPIIPVQLLVNAETGFCKVKLAFKLKGKWKDVVVDKEIISSASKIVSLSKHGIRVTSENAKMLVQYLSDMEALNEYDITEQISTSKLGWIKGEFMPYGNNVVFDNEQNLKNVFDSIVGHGDKEEWYRLVKEIRANGKMEAKIYLVSSFASVMLDFVNALPFIVNLYGLSGKGKTVALMLAASVWADPSEGKFMTDAKTTTTASEIRLNFLNNLPLLIDDMAQVKEQYRDDFSQLIYAWCSGSGKGRGNKGMGLNASMTWRNIIITNAERSLVNEFTQGGAINRIIDVEMSDGYIFENGNKVVDVLKSNYGYAGREFVELLQSMDKEEIQQIQKGYYNRILNRSKIMNTEKEEKQMLPMSVLLATDYLIEKHLFRDGCLLDFDSCVNLLKSKAEVSENDRAYNYLLDEIQMNNSKFASKEDVKTLNECWGVIDIDNELIMINGNAFKGMMKKGNFSEKTFLSWLAKNNKIELDSKGRTTKNKKINGIQGRCVFLKLPGYIQADENGFIKIDEEQEKLPFD